MKRRKNMKRKYFSKLGGAPPRRGPAQPHGYSGSNSPRPSPVGVSDLGGYDSHEEDHVDISPRYASPPHAIGSVTRGKEMDGVYYYSVNYTLSDAFARNGQVEKLRRYNDFYILKDNLVKDGYEEIKKLNLPPKSWRCNDNCIQERVIGLNQWFTDCIGIGLRLMNGINYRRGKKLLQMIWGFMDDGWNTGIIPIDSQ